MSLQDNIHLELSDLNCKILGLGLGLGPDPPSSTVVPTRRCGSHNVVGRWLCRLNKLSRFARVGSHYALLSRGKCAILCQNIGFLTHEPSSRG